jgi:putative flippase GtrA
MRGEPIRALIGRFLRHCLVGGSGTALYLLILVVLVDVFHHDPVPSSVLAFLVLIVFTYLLSYRWVFRAQRAHRSSLPRFLTVCAIGLLLNTSIIYLTVNVLGLWYVWGQVVATLVIPVTNFVLLSQWTFK